MEELTLLETIEWSQHHSDTCAGQPVIPAYNFSELALDVLEFKEVRLKHTKEEVLVIFEEQASRFTACGANNADRLGVLRKNPKSGWKYLIDILVGNVKKPE